MAASGDIQDMIKNLQEALIQSNQVVFEEKEQLKLKIKELTEENALLREENSKFTSGVPHDVLLDFKNKLEKLKSDVEIEKTIHKNETQILKSQIESFTEERAKLTETIIKLETESHRLLKDVKGLNEENIPNISYLKGQLSECTRLNEIELELAETNKKNDELEAQLLQMRIDLSAERTKLEEQLVLHNGQIELAKVTESKLAECNKKNEEFETQLLQLQADLSAQKTELEKNLVLRNGQLESAKETESKLAETTALNEPLKAKVQQLHDELSVEVAEKGLLLDSYNILLKSCKITEAKLVETTELNEELRAELLELQEELSLERSETIELLDLCKSHIESAQETETNNHNEALKYKFLRLENYLCLEEFLCQLHSYEALLEFLKEIESKLGESFKFIDELNVTQLLQLQDKLSAHSTELLEEVNSYKNQLESANVTKCELAKELEVETLALPRPAAMRLDVSSKDDLSQASSNKVDLSRDSSNKDDLSRDSSSKDDLSRDSSNKDYLSRDSSNKDDLSRDSSSKDDLSRDSSNKDDLSRDSSNKDYLSMDSSKALSDAISFSSKCLQTIAALDEDTHGSVDFIKSPGERGEEKISENNNLADKGVLTLDQALMFISLLRDNLAEYRAVSFGRCYTQPSRNLECGPCGPFLTFLDTQIKLDELHNKFKLDVMVKQNEINFSNNVNLSPEISTATQNYFKTERFFYLSYWEVYQHICTKNKLTITDKDCQDVAARLKCTLKSLKNSMVELKKKLQTTTSVKDQAEINLKIKDKALQITETEGKLIHVPTLSKVRQKDNEDRAKEAALKHKGAVESFFQAQKVELDVENQLETELKKPGLARDVLDSFNDLLQKSLFDMATLTYEVLNSVKDQIPKVETNISSDATNQDLIQYLEYLKTVQIELENQSKLINDQIYNKLCDEKLVEMAKNLTEWESKLVSIKVETNKRCFEGLIDFGFDSLQNKFKSFAKSLNIDSKMAADFLGTICQFNGKSELQPLSYGAGNTCNYLTIREQLNRVETEKSKMDKLFKETTEQLENMKKDGFGEGIDLAAKNSEIICLEDDKQKLTKEIAALKKKSQKMADTKEAEKSDLKKEIKTLQDDKIKLQKNIDKLKLDIGKLKEKHCRQNSELEESFKRDLINVVEEKNKILTDYKEIKIKYNEYNHVIRSKNAEIEDLKQKLEAKCDRVMQLLTNSVDSENLKRQIQQDRGLFQQRQKQLEDKIQKLVDEKENLQESNVVVSKLLQSREMQLKNAIADSEKAELKLQRLMTDKRSSEASLKLQLQNVIADSKKTEFKMQKVIDDNKTSEASLKLQLQNVIADSKKTELKMQKLIADNKASEASLKLQLQNVIADSKKTEFKMQKLIADNKASEASLKLQLQNVTAGASGEVHLQRFMEGNAKTVETMKQLRTNLERAIFLVHEVENVIFEILEKELSCSICHETMVQSNILNCNHSFCEACIRDWAENEQRECPVCHSPILMQKQAAFLDTMIETLTALYEKLTEFVNKFPAAVE